MGVFLVDKYSYLHFSVGIIFFYYNISFVNSLFIHLLFEYIENTNLGIFIIDKYIKFWPGGKKYSDSFINIIGDTISFCIGWYTAYLISNKNINLKKSFI
jgi:hypothetical protein